MSKWNGFERRNARLNAFNALPWQFHGNFRTRQNAGRPRLSAEKSAEMAAQLDKRARQLAEQKGRSYDEACSIC